MNKIPYKIKYLIYGLCGLIFVALNFGIRAKLYIGLIESLQKITDYFFGISTNTLDYLTFASIPFFGMLYNSTRKEFKKSELIMDILTVLFCVTIISVIGIYLLIYVGRSSNPLIPEYLLTEPFDLYSTILIGIGILTPYLIVKLTKK
ncbi:hypothetical protein [Aquimarina sp. 2304DJ70-9]|uniref:hypothetical protein n=1 Tax=Aquimarina penaris TaxID=3231044 RepID=UPI0034630EFD